MQPLVREGAHQQQYGPGEAAVWPRECVGDAAVLCSLGRWPTPNTSCLPGPSTILRQPEDAAKSCKAKRPPSPRDSQLPSAWLPDPGPCSQICGQASESHSGPFGLFLFFSQSSFFFFFRDLQCKVSLTPSHNWKHLKGDPRASCCRFQGSPGPPTASPQLQHAVIPLAPAAPPPGS